eukprot:2516922-Amphidinium_carterae.1
MGGIVPRLSFGSAREPETDHSPRKAETDYSQNAGTTCFNASLLSGASATIEISDEATVEHLHMIVRSKLSIRQDSFVKVLAGCQLLEPQTATIKELKNFFGDWTDAVPVDLTIVVAELKVKRHIYQEQGHSDVYVHIASEEAFLDPSKTLTQQEHALRGDGSTFLAPRIRHLERLQRSPVRGMPVETQPPAYVRGQDGEFAQLLDMEALAQ